MTWKWDPVKDINKRAKLELNPKKLLEHDVRSFDRILDKNVGIDDEGTRKAIIVGIATVASWWAGGQLGSLAGAMYGGAVTGSAAAGAGLLGGSTAAATGGAIGSYVGAYAGSGAAADALAGPLPAGYDATKALPTTPFKSGADILNSQDVFRKKLAEKRGLTSTNQTEGIRGPSSVMRPTLFTL